MHENKDTPKCDWVSERGGDGGVHECMFRIQPTHLKTQTPLELCIKNKCVTPGVV
jgi:hypothetical protein